MRSTQYSDPGTSEPLAGLDWVGQNGLIVVYNLYSNTIQIVHYGSMTLEIFFSYDSADSLLVKQIKEGIEKRTADDVSVYIFEEDPSPGETISSKAKAGIRNSDLLFVLITPNSKNSPWVQQEVGFANGVGCPVVPILPQARDVPELEGLLEGVEYLTFNPEKPDEFFESFFDYAIDNWDLQTTYGTEDGKPTKENETSESGETDTEDILPLPSLLAFVSPQTFTSLHALELGIYVGMMGYFMVSIGYAGEVVTFLLAVARIAQSEWRVKTGSSRAKHRIGVHDLRKKPIVFGVGVLTAYLLLVLLIDIVFGASSFPHISY